MTTYAHPNAKHDGPCGWCQKAMVRLGQTDQLVKELTLAAIKDKK